MRKCLRVACPIYHGWAPYDFSSRFFHVSLAFSVVANFRWSERREVIERMKQRGERSQRLIKTWFNGGITSLDYQMMVKKIFDLLRSTRQLIMSMLRFYIFILTTEKGPAGGSIVRKGILGWFISFVWFYDVSTMCFKYLHIDSSLYRSFRRSITFDEKSIEYIIQNVRKRTDRLYDHWGFCESLRGERTFWCGVVKDWTVLWWSILKRSGWED